MRNALLLALLFTAAPLTGAADSLPEVDTAKPWTRWWWLGSGVDEENLTHQLESFAQAGIGGVEICPIYGAKGYEDRDLNFLSEDWIAMLDHTSAECARLGLGLDLTTGTGWPFGGPWVTPEMASHSLLRLDEELAAGPLKLQLPAGDRALLRAWPKNGEPVDLLDHVEKGVLTWDVPEGGAHLYGIFTQSPIQKVKRAAPGAAGPVVDPFSPDSLSKYLSHFDAPLDRLAAPQPRSHFHDSFEYYGAAWTPDFPAAFREDHGYEFADHLPAFFGEGQPQEVADIHHDYRTTLDRLHRSYLATWHDWANARGSLTRNQAHGSPGNLLDHYAVADIPETEIFRHVEHPQIPMLQFAASAAHVTGRNLVSAESFTWLGEHFQVKPSALKEAADFLWLGGVNHLFFHGIPYSPADAEWPGWLFYASTHMGENGGLWRELPAFNRYIHTVQNELQSGRPDTAGLLYFPVDDLWAQPSDKLPLFTIHNQNEWLHGSDFHAAAMTFWEHGIPCDFVSTRLLEKATVEDGKILLGGHRYDLLLIPEHERAPEAFQQKCTALREKGASIADLPERTEKPDPAPLLQLLESHGLRPEPITRHGIRFVRRVTDEGHSWFLVNPTETTIDESIALTTPFTSALFIDPSRPDRRGTPRLTDGRIHFHLEPGESRLLRTSTTSRHDAGPWVDFTSTAEPLTIDGPWKIEFIAGGPELPQPFNADLLASWTSRSDAARNFSGTARYTTTFTAGPGRFVLDLGEVAETCRVTLNGKPLGSSFFPPHRFELPGALAEGENTLAVEVTNLAANRIADADRRGVKWKAFHEINFVNIDYQPFDASGWEPLPSGLLGPVKLLPLP